MITIKKGGVELDISTLRPSKEETSILWRDAQLAETDRFVKTPDFPYIQEIMEYRQELRDWPASEDFPDNMPEAPLTQHGKSIL